MGPFIFETRGSQKQTRARPGSIIFETRGSQNWDPRVSKTDFDQHLLTCGVVIHFLDVDAQNHHGAIHFWDPRVSKTDSSETWEHHFWNPRVSKLRPAGFKNRLWSTSLNLRCCHSLLGCRCSKPPWGHSFLRPAGLKNRLERDLGASFLRPAGLKIETRGSQKQTLINIS